MATRSIERARAPVGDLAAALALLAGLSAFATWFAGAGAGTRFGTSSPPPAFDESSLIAADLRARRRNDAVIVGDRSFDARGAGRRLRSYFFESTGRANVMLDRIGSPVAFPEFGVDLRSGPMVARTGVALREFTASAAAEADTTFSVPCATTSLDADQSAYVYLGAFAPDSGGRLRLTEIGVQLNGSRGGGAPRSVQIYTRRETASGIRISGTPLHLRCDEPLHVSLSGIGSASLAATFAGPAVPLSSRSFTLVVRGGDETGLWTAGCRRCRLERVTAMAVESGTAPLRRHRRFGVRPGRASPNITYAGSTTFGVSASPSVPQVLVTTRDGRTRVGIDEDAR